MFGTLVVFASLSQWLVFGPTPLPGQVVEGQRVYAQGKGIDRTLKDSRVVLGVWFDGRIKDDVESIVWISPRMASRWLGYLQAKEKWPKGEIQRRWDRIRDFVNGRMCFVVRLSAMPKLVGLEMESGGKPSTTDILEPSFRLTSGPGYPFPIPKLTDRILRSARKPTYPYLLKSGDPLPEPVEPCELHLLARRQTRERSKLERYQWFQDLPLRDAFEFKNQTFEMDEGYGLGDFGSAWYWVSFPLGRWAACAGGFEVWVVTLNKERVGSFRFVAD